MEWATEYPWNWSAGLLDERMTELAAAKDRAETTIRFYRASMRMFCDYIASPYCQWVEECEEPFGNGDQREDLLSPGGDIAAGTDDARDFGVVGHGPIEASNPELAPSLIQRYPAGAPMPSEDLQRRGFGEADGEGGEGALEWARAPGQVLDGDGETHFRERVE
jgi:hypothetical protein